jgi:nitrite reductase (NADH) large subunit
MRVGILGVGHAGVKAAETLAAQQVETVLYSAEEVLPYYRPRLIAVACGQEAPDAIAMHPAHWYTDNGIDLRRGCRVEAVDTATRCVHSDGRQEQFDALVIATGAGPFRPSFMKEVPGQVVPLWSMEDTLAIRAAIRPGLRMVIAGGGILGIETALRARDAGVEVTVVELVDRLMALQFGPHASQLIEQALAERGIHIRTACAVEQIQPAGDNALKVRFNDRTDQEADLVVVSVGARRDVSIFKDPGLQIERGIQVDYDMRTSVERVYAAGDIVQLPAVNRCSALDATLQGRTAAANILAEAEGRDPALYAPGSGSVNLKYDTFEIHSAGIAFDERAKELILEADAAGAYAALLEMDGQIVGIQMVGTGKDFRAYEKKLVRDIKKDGPVGMENNKTRQ